MRDHPIIENLMRTGFPDGRAHDNPVCPVCGEECEIIYTANGEAVGCDCCLERHDAWEWSEK